MRMKIGFIGGTGEEGMGLAYRFALAGHTCIIGSRALEKAQGAVDELREKDASLPLEAATNEDAAASADVIIVTTPYSAQSPTLPPLAAVTAGKIVVSTVVPMAFEAGKATLTAVPEGSAAEQEQALLPDARVVGAFQNLGARKLLRGVPMNADVVVCADDEDAKAQVMQLAEQIEGVRGVDGGPLSNAKIVEGITVLLVAVNRHYKVNASIKVTGIK
jgi:NADPH-dependent F420 reductase